MFWGHISKPPELPSGMDDALTNSLALSVCQNAGESRVSLQSRTAGFTGGKLQHLNGDGEKRRQRPR